MKIPRTEKIRMLKSSGMSEKDAVMASMKKAPEPKGGSSPKVSMGPSHDAYPYGLKLELDDEALKKLNLKDMPKAGSSVHLHAKAKVESTSHRQEHGEKARRSASLQITHMRMQHAPTATADTEADTEADS